MTPTKPWLLIVLAVLATAIGFAAVGLWEAAFGRTMPVPWSAAATLLLLAIALLGWGIAIRPRLLRKRGTKPLSPFVAARTAALAMAASRTGALVAGFYLGTALAFLGDLTIPVTKERMWFSLAAAACAVLVALAALWLEYICRLPGDDDDEKKNIGGRADSDEADWVLPSTQRPPAKGGRRQ